MTRKPKARRARGNVVEQTGEQATPLPLSDKQKAKLRARAEALVAEYGAPLPDGDAGLIEAERRLHELDPRRLALGDNSAMGEEEITDIAFNAMCRLDERIATTPAATLAGAAVKLRRLLHPELGMEIGNGENDLPCLHHILSVIEREAGVAASPEVARRLVGRKHTILSPRWSRRHWRFGCSPATAMPAMPLNITVAMYRLCPPHLPLPRSTSGTRS
jgi:hypothetical protein